MLEKARDRVARKGIRNVRLLEMDAADLKFADDTFDIVYAPYLISVVPDPVAGRARDAPRLPSGRTDHHPEPFPQRRTALARASNGRLHPSPFISVSSPISTCRRSSRRPTFSPISIEKVNVPRIWSLVTCIKQ